MKAGCDGFREQTLCAPGEPCACVSPGPCFGPYAIQSQERGLYVNTYPGGDVTNLLETLTSAPTNLGKYYVCSDGAKYGIYSLYGKSWVATEVSFTGEREGALHARATSVGPEEKFELQNNPDFSVSLKSVANGLFVSVDSSSSSPARLLRARSKVASVLESFHFILATP